MVWSCCLIMSESVFKLVWASSTLGSISIVIKCRFRLIRIILLGEDMGLNFQQLQHMEGASIKKSYGLLL